MKFEILPKHLAIIPDGNRRWAREKNLPDFFGHKEGYKRSEEIIQEAKDLGIEYVSIWAFSTENWKRKEDEKSELFSLIARGLTYLHDTVLQRKSRFVHLGRKDRLGTELLQLISTLEEETREYTAFTLCVAIDYGGEDEILRASEAYKKSEDTTKALVHFLDTSRYGIPSPDFIIRTSGEKRTSGFMPLQSVYSEWYFNEKHFPNFGKEDLHLALADYASRERRQGR